MKKAYEQALADVGFTYDAEGVDLFILAGNIDDARRRLAEDATETAARFARWAQAVASGDCSEPPTGYSTLRDMGPLHAEMKANIAALMMLVRRSMPEGMTQSGIAKFRAALTARLAE